MDRIPDHKRGENMKNEKERTCGEIKELEENEKDEDSRRESLREGREGFRFNTGK